MISESLLNVLAKDLDILVQITKIHLEIEANSSGRVRNASQAIL